MKKENKETRPLGAPGPIPDCYVPHIGGLNKFALTGDQLERLEARREQRRAEAREFLADLGLGPWWE